MLLLQNKDVKQTKKYCEFAKRNSGTIRETNIAASNESLNNF